MTRPARQIFAFYVTVFLSAYLLFAVEPMIAKALLPGFGGSFVVWGACMAFFQGVLIFGYGWAHGIQRRLGVLRYSRWHIALLLLPLLCWGGGHEAIPRQGVPLYFEVVRLLTFSVGAPFFALSTTSLILQRWLSDSDLPQRDNPYVLYAASNAGSILALLSYPLMLEPLLTLAMQWRVWWILYAVTIGLHVLCLPRRGAVLRAAGEFAIPESVAQPLAPARVGARQFTLWITLSLAGCAMLLAVTNTITFDVASIPLFWTLPLAVYLFTFVLLFKRRPWNPAWMKPASDWTIAAAAVVYLLMQLRLTFPLALQLVLQLSFLFIICMRVHGLLAASRPTDLRLLTTYFLCMSVGGFLGSLLVSWVVPMVFSTLIEFPLALALAAVGAALCEPHTAANRDSRRWLAPALVATIATVVAALVLVPWLARLVSLPLEAVAALCALPLVLAIRAGTRRPRGLVAALAAFALFVQFTEPLAEGEHGIHRLRNFYGLYKIFDQDGIRYLQHGSTAHGREYLDAARAGTPLSYFHPSTPAAGLMQADPLHARNIAMIGLGTGALATYLHAGQRFTVYELDPDNLPIAQADFNYLNYGRAHGGQLSFVFGDGRINLRAMPAASYDMLIVDAFSSDAIPVHMLTVEAMREYFRVLRPDGLLLMHISNKYIPLEPLIASLTRALHYHAVHQTNQGAIAEGADLTFWAAVARNEATLSPLVQHLGWSKLSTALTAQLPAPWTDQYSNLLGLLLQR